MQERDTNDDHDAKQEETIRCPQCDSRVFHVLADNRRQCSQCRKKYSLPKKAERLPPVHLERIADLFWRFIPADQAADRINLNRKTVQRYYAGLRQGIHAENTREWQTVAANTRQNVTRSNPAVPESTSVIFWILTCQGQIHVLFPQDVGAGKLPASPSSVVLARNKRALEQQNIDVYLHNEWQGSQPAGAEEVRLGKHFWIYAKANLPRYRGGYKKNFPLFMAEMEFRYNHRSDTTTPQCLLRMCRNI